jgi:DNA-binding MarR family transcriptional regulator
MWINVLFHKLRKYNNANMQSLGITGVQSRVMHYILVKCVEGPVFQRDVERAFGLSRSTATGILQLMEKNGLILRESVHNDARLKSLVPTEKAAHLDAQIGESLRRTEQRLTRGLSSAQLTLFLQTAAHMSANLDG